MKCPDGHESTATDYCDVCGVAMDATATVTALPDDASAGAGDTGAGASTQDCPNCQAPNTADALFCEACGYDFTTGAMPRRVTPSGAPDAPAGADGGSAGGGSPAEATASDNISPPLADAWVAEVWVDPDWYADQQSGDPLPSPGLPLVVPLRNTSILIGRASRSRGISPDIDLSSDNGISRRHAQLTTDGSRWWVEDLGSSNGTYVGGSVGVLPKTPVAPGQKQEVKADDRIYLGAWTRITVRKATPGEV
ncbi:FHA domain-containing protein [Nocardioides sp. SYSU D00038]|uniref:FHA domain-containing protein n=1 Tax=Nocardioides sp. SYSU D00038 TaxID=2812554 RepID=UPI0027DEA280|nr:FHA domain-containing protein [Nocardioides sp. SYSU D00038]